MWGVAHDKVLEFIKTGELEAFNVASKRSRRPQFKVTLAAVKAFQERRSGRDPARSAPPDIVEKATAVEPRVLLTLAAAGQLPRAGPKSHE